MHKHAALLLISIVAVAQVTQAEPPAPKNTKAMQRAPLNQAPRKLDLRLPDITTIFPQEMIDQVLSKTRDRDTIEEVEVEGVRTRIVPGTPAIPSGWFSPFWALAHPSEAWRIFAPLPPDRALLVANTPPDASDSYRVAPMPRGIAIGD